MKRQFNERETALLESMQFDTKKYTTREYEESEELEELAKDIIKKQLLDILPAKVAYLMVSPNISNTVPAKILKATPEVKFFSDCNYVVEFSRDVFNSLDDETRRIIMHDLLIRILPVMNEVKGEYQFKLRNPDLIAFKRIIDLYGTDWKTKVKLVMSSMYNLSPVQEDAIKI